MVWSSCSRIFRSRRFRWTVRFLVLAVILLGIAAILFPQKTLTVDSGPVRGDVIVVLGGAPHDRAERAAELFKDGAAPRILISGVGDDKWNQRILLQADVPTNAIQIEPDSFTTRENALYSIPLLHALGARRVIIVTSWFHSRRALRTFQHYGPDITFYSRPSYFGFPGEKGRGESVAGRGAQVSSNSTVSALHSSSSSPAAWLTRKDDWRAVRGFVKTEYVKLIGYWFYYGVCPF